MKYHYIAKPSKEMLKAAATDYLRSSRRGAILEEKWDKYSKEKDEVASKSEGELWSRFPDSSRFLELYNKWADSKIDEVERDELRHLEKVWIDKLYDIEDELVENHIWINPSPSLYTMERLENHIPHCKNAIESLCRQFGMESYGILKKAGFSMEDMDPFLPRYWFLEESMDRDKLKAEYRRLARRLHPDVGGSEDEMAKLNEEYEELCA